MELRLFTNAAPEIDRVALLNELISFASSYKDLKKELLENMNDNENDLDSLQSEKEYSEKEFEYSPHFFLEILRSKSLVRTIHEVKKTYFLKRQPNR